MKIDIGMYARTNDGEIMRITSHDYPYWHKAEKGIGVYEPDIKTASQNLIELVEVGDIVNGNKVLCIFDEGTYAMGKTVIQIGEEYLSNKDIETIITHEKMERISYKVGDNK